MKILRNKYPYILFFFASLIPFWINVSKTSSNAILNLRDFDTPIDVAFDLYVRFFAWDSHWGLGLPNSGAFILLSKNLIFSFLKLFHLPLIYIEKTYLSGIFFLLGCGAYYFVTNYFNLNEKHRRLCGLVAGLFYMFNIPVYTRLIGVPHILISVALYPVLLVLLLRVVHSRDFRDAIKPVIYSALVSVFALSADPSLIVAYFLCLSLAIPLHILLDRKSISLKVVTASLAVVLLLTFLLNLWWLSPILEGAFGSRELLAGTIAHPHNVEVFNAANNLVSFFDGVRLHWTKRGFSILAPDGTPYFRPKYIENFYNSPYSYMLFFLFLAASLYVAFRDRDNKKQVVIVSLIGLVAILFSFGTHFPVFGKIHEFLFYKVPGFQVLRNFFKFQFVVLIWYTSLAALFCNYLMNRWGGTKQNIALILSLAVGSVILNALPLTAPNLAGRHEFFTVPSYYLEARSWLRSENSDIYRVLVIPQGTWEETYEWGPKFELVPIHRNFFRDSVLLLQEPDEAKKIIDPVEELKVDDLNKYLSLLNVRYILIRRDIYEANLTEKNRSLIERLPKVLEKQNIYLAGSFGKLDFYKIPDKYFVPHIYTAANLISIAGDADLASLVSLGEFPGKTGIFFLKSLGTRETRLAVNRSNQYYVTATPTALAAKPANGEYTGMRYVFPKAGKYEILIRVGKGIRSQNLKGAYLNIDGEPMGLRIPIARPDGWASLGYFVFKKGQRWLSLYPLDGKRANGWTLNKDVVLRGDGPSNGVSPKISSRKVNPTKHIIRVSGAKGPYLLVFSEFFHPGWKAYIREADPPGSKDAIGEASQKRIGSFFWQTWFKKPLSEDKHFLVNGYANSWWIDKTGSYEVILEYWPQRLFYTGLAVSSFTLIVCLGYLIFLRVNSQDGILGKLGREIAKG